MVYDFTREKAQQLLQTLPIGEGVKPNKRIIRYEVRAYSWDEDSTPKSYGVWPVWKYLDHDGTFGGPFIWF